MRAAKREAELELRRIEEAYRQREEEFRSNTKGLTLEISSEASVERSRPTPRST